MCAHEGRQTGTRYRKAEIDNAGGPPAPYPNLDTRPAVAPGSSRRDSALPDGDQVAPGYDPSRAFPQFSPRENIYNTASEIQIAMHLEKVTVFRNLFLVAPGSVPSSISCYPPVTEYVERGGSGSRIPRSIIHSSYTPVPTKNHGIEAFGALPGGHSDRGRERGRYLESHGWQAGESPSFFDVKIAARSARGPGGGRIRSGDEHRRKHQGQDLPGVEMNAPIITAGLTVLSIRRVGLSPVQVPPAMPAGEMLLLVDLIELARAIDRH
ncbi:hypothetical protein KM043_008307 [Ampulex compressa]|nr:hypothetical protein KM043_008307 [Ampulex compressa]